MYLQKDSIDYLIYKGQTKVDDHKAKKFNIPVNTNILITIILDSLQNNITFNIQLSTNYNKMLYINSRNFYIDNIKFTDIIKYYNSSLSQINKSLQYQNMYNF